MRKIVYIILFAVVTTEVGAQTFYELGGDIQSSFEGIEGSFKKEGGSPGGAYINCIPEENKKILLYLENKIKKKVGDGMCLTLIDSTLLENNFFKKKIGPTEFDTTLNDYCIIEIKKEDILPGDIVFVEKIVMRNKESGEKITICGGGLTHIAFVGFSDNEYFCMIEQNVYYDGKEIKEVIVSKYKKSSIIKEKMYFYRVISKKKLYLLENKTN